MTDPGRASSGHRPLPIRRLLVIACVMVAGITGLWMLIDRFSDVDVNGPTPPPATPFPIATPDDDGAIPPRAGSLPDLLRYAPDLLGGDSLPLTDVARYADIATWMDARSLPVPELSADAALEAWRAELTSLALTPALADRGLDPEWRQSYGFGLTQVHQVLVAGQAPDYVTILRGAFDRAALYDAWVGSGYQAVEVEGATVWTLFPGDTIDLSNPASRPAMGMLNNLVLLDDGTLVGAAKLPRLGSVLRVVNGNATSLAGNGQVASLTGPATDSDELVSAVIARGGALQALPSDLPRRAGLQPPPQTLGQSLNATAGAASLAAGMPGMSLAMIGISPPPPRTGDVTPVAGTPPSGLDHPMRMVLSFDNRDDARSARRVIEHRFREHLSPVTGAAYGERYGAVRIRVLDVPGDVALVEIEATLPRGSTDWLTMMAERDAGFAFWIAPYVSTGE